MTDQIARASDFGRPPAATDEEIAFGVIPCRIGADVRYMRTRKHNSARTWKAELSRKLAGTLAEYDIPELGKGRGAQTLESILGLGMLGSDVVLELVVSYDERGTLGGSEWLGENADDHELYTILRQILERHFPFVRDVLSAMGTLAGLLATGAQEAVAEALHPQGVQSSPPNSSNGASQTGGSTPTRSRRPSTSRS